MSDNYELVWKEGSFFSNGGWRWQKKDDGSGAFVAFFIMLAIALVVGSIMIMTSSMLAPLFAFCQMRPAKRHIAAIIGVLGFTYFVIDLGKEWISSLLFYGWKSDDGEFTSGLFGEEAVTYFWVINSVGLALNIYLILDYYRRVNKNNQ